MALRVWLPLNGTLENKGISNIIPTFTNPVYTNGKIGEALQITNQASSYMTIPSLVDSQILSAMCWVKLRSGNTFTAYADVLSFKVRKSTGSALGLMRLEVNTNANSMNWYANSLLATDALAKPAIPISANDTWHHLAITLDGTVVTTYLDGLEYYVHNIAEDYVNYSFQGEFKFGDSGMYCDINDIRIYDHCLSPKEVKEIAQGLILHYKLDGFSGGVGDNILTGTNNQTINRTQDNLNTTTNTNGLWGWGSGGNGTCTLLDLSNDSPLPAITHGFSVANNTTGNRDYQQGKIPYKSGVKYTASWYARGTCTMLIRSWNSTDGKQMVSTSPKIDTTDWQYMTWTFTASEEMSTDFCTFHIGLTGTGSVEFCGMKLEEGSVATRWTPAPQDLDLNTTVLVDSSGYNNNAENINGHRTITDLEGRYNVASVFDGTNYYKTILPFTSDQWTASCWYYKTTAPTGYESFLCLSKDSGSDANKKIYIGLNNNLIGAVAEGTWSAVSRTNLLNQWVFASLTYDGTTAALYENGELIKTFTDNTILTDCTDLTIGVRPSASGATSVSLPFNGYLSDARIYATALSAEDILDLYHTSASVDNLGNMHRFEFVEDDSISIYKNGLVESTKLDETNFNTNAQFMKETLNIRAQEFIEK